LARIPDGLYAQLVSYITALEASLLHIVPKTIKGSLFSHKVSPGQSRIFLAEELHEKPFATDLSLNLSHLNDELEGETTNKEAINNISAIEKQAIEEVNDEIFVFPYERATPMFVNLDELVDEIQERRSRTSSKMYKVMRSPSPVHREGDDFIELSKNGRWFRRMSDVTELRILRAIEPRPPASEPKFMKNVRKCQSTKEVIGSQMKKKIEGGKVRAEEEEDNDEFQFTLARKGSKDVWID
jgi:hypothetical protein